MTIKNVGPGTDTTKTFLKTKCANPGHFLLIFVLLSLQIQSYKLKKHRWCGWDSNPGNVGADETIELRRPPYTAKTWLTQVADAKNSKWGMDYEITFCVFLILTNFAQIDACANGRFKIGN